MTGPDFLEPDEIIVANFATADRSSALRPSSAKPILSVMSSSDTHDQRFAKMSFAMVYPLYLKKVEKKGRTREELHQVIKWLTGFGENKLQKLLQSNVTFEQFFKQATIHKNAQLITGVICGYRVENIENPLTQQVRYLDKLVDELAKGLKMEKILRDA